MKVIIVICSQPLPYPGVCGSGGLVVLFIVTKAQCFPLGPCLAASAVICMGCVHVLCF